MKRLLGIALLLPVTATFAEMSIAPTMEPNPEYMEPELGYTTTYLRPETRAMVRRNDAIRLQAVENQLATLYAQLANLKSALLTEPANAGQIQKTIDMVNDSIDRYEGQMRAYKRSLGM